MRSLAIAALLLVGCGDNEAYPPLAVDDLTVVTAEDSPVAFVISHNAQTFRTITIDLTTPAHGEVTGGDGDYSYTPEANYVGSDALVVTVGDGLASVSANIAISITGVNDAPVGVADSFAALQDTPLAIERATLVANDTDVEAQVLTVDTVSGAVNGTVALTGDHVTFTPATGFVGDAGFDYTVTDGEATGTAHVTIAIATMNRPPTATDDALATAEDTPIVVDTSAVLGNDTDPDAQTLAVTTTSNAVNCTVARTGTTLTITPHANFAGTATFDYVVTDGALTDTGTVVVTVTAVNDAPLALDVTATTTPFTPVDITLLATDGDSPSLTYAIVTPPANGAVVVTGSVARYTPNPVFDGSVSFTYRANDGVLDSNVATVTVTVGENPCGDGNVDLGEECDDGDANDGNGCDRRCRFTCASGTGALAVTVDGFSASCYAAYGPTASYDAAAALCESHGGFLATIITDRENTAVRAAAAALPGRGWIGLADRVTEGQFLWSTTNEPVGFTAFAAGEPSATPANDCGQIDATGWHTAACGGLASPICELPRFPDISRIRTGGITDLALADFDADGDVDFFGTPDFSYAENDGTGTFAYTFQLLPNAQTLFALAGDVDGDGDADALRFGAQNTIQVQLGDGGGGFGAIIESVLPPGIYTTDPHLADLDGDGDVDLVLGDMFNTRFATLAGDGAGGFTFVRTQLLADYAGSLDVVDWNADGILDLVMTQRDNPIVILAGTAVPFAYAPLANLPVAGDPKWVRVADLDGDLDPDLVTLSGTGTLSWFHGDGAGAITGSGSTTVGATTGGFVPRFALGDVDADGHVDVVVENVTWRHLAVFFGAATGTFGAPAVFLPHNSFGFRDLEVDDLDGDGIDDILLATGGQPQLAFYRGSATRQFENALVTPAPAASFVAPSAIAAGDLDGDGTDEIVAAVGPGSLAVLRREATGYAVQATLAYGGTSTVVRLRLADLDLDGDLDVVVIDGRVRTFTNTGGVLAAGPASSALAQLVDVDVVDVRGDPRPDVITVTTSGTITVYDETLAEVALASGMGASSAIVVRDFDGDGRADAVTGGAQLSIARWIGGATVFGAATAIDVQPVPIGAGDILSLTAGDFDDDGTLDLGFGVTNLGVRLLGNDGSGAFPTWIDDHGGPATTRIVVDDFDHDGQDDLAYVSAMASASSVFVARHRPDGYFTDPFERSAIAARDVAAAHGPNGRIEIVTIEGALPAIFIFRDGWR